VEMLHKLCNQIYCSKDGPKDWGKAIIVHKKGDRAACSNYQAISLLSVPGKVYTKVLQQRLKRYVESMSEEQVCFRKGRGTTDPILQRHYRSTTPPRGLGGVVRLILPLALRFVSRILPHRAATLDKSLTSHCL